MKASGYIITVFLLATLAAPLAAQVNDTYVIAVAGAVRGGANTNWATQADIFNPQAYWLTVSIVFIPTHGEPGVEVLLDIGPNENITVDNILEDWFELRGTGSLLLATFPEDNPDVPDDVLSRSFLVTTRTYNTTNIGTYGQSIPGVWAGLFDFDFDGISAISHGVRNYGTPGVSGYRTNVGAVNLGRWSVTLLVNVYDTFGDIVAEGLEFKLFPMGHEQQALPVSVVDGTVEFFLDDPTQDSVVFPYISVVDNRSGDGVYGNPILLADPDILFKKKMAHQSVGKEIDTGTARLVRERTERLGRIVRTGEDRILQRVD